MSFKQIHYVIRQLEREQRQKEAAALREQRRRVQKALRQATIRVVEDHVGSAEGRSGASREGESTIAVSSSTFGSRDCGAYGTVEARGKEALC